MKKFLKTILIFIPVSIFIYLVLIFLWGSFVPQTLRKNMLAPKGLYFTYEKLEEAKKKQNLDILIVGPSLAYRAFDTRLFEQEGYNTFNLGTTSQTPIQTKYLLENYLESTNPKLVIFAVSPDVFSLDGIESAMDIIANETNNAKLRKMMVDYNDIRLYNTWIYALCWNGLNKLGVNWSYDTFQKDFYAKLKGKDRYISGGYVEKELIFFKQIQYSNRFSWDYKKEQFEAFDECLNMIKNKSDVLLVQVPITSSLYNNHSNNNYFDSIMNTSGTYYNYNGMIELNDSLHFYDAFHLNQKGVEAFGEEFLKLLKLEYPLLNSK
jgi:hypothetical protein